MPIHVMALGHIDDVDDGQSEQLSQSAHSEDLEPFGPVHGTFTSGSRARQVPQYWHSVVTVRNTQPCSRPPLLRSRTTCKSIEMRPIRSGM